MTMVPARGMSACASKPICPPTPCDADNEDPCPTRELTGLHVAKLKKISETNKENTKKLRITLIHNA